MTGNGFTRLPSASLGPTDLQELNDLLNQLLHKERITVTVSREGIEKTYDSLEEMLADELLPSLIRARI